jgi:hypothetical protein
MKTCPTCDTAVHVWIEERDAAIARAEKAEAERDELGIQLAAQSERLRLAMACVSILRLRGEHEEGADSDALAALDAVPGDALAKVGTLNGVSVHVDPNLPEHDPWVAVKRDLKVGDRVRYLAGNPPEAFVGVVDMVEDREMGRINGQWLVKVERDWRQLPSFGPYFWCTADVLAKVDGVKGVE